MNYIKLNNNWGAEPNVPEVQLKIEGNTIFLEFFLNYEHTEEDDKGVLKFRNCHKYSFNSMNDEGYYLGQYRYKYTELPWGEFYKIETNWESDFPESSIELKELLNKDSLSHFIFFFRDNTFECVAENYEFSILKA